MKQYKIIRNFRMPSVNGICYCTIPHLDFDGNCINCGGELIIEI